MALAIILSVVLPPHPALAESPLALAAIGVVLVAFAGITALTTVMATQVTQLAGDLPRCSLVAHLLREQRARVQILPPTSQRSQTVRWTLLTCASVAANAPTRG